MSALQSVWCLPHAGEFERLAKDAPEKYVEESGVLAEGSHTRVFAQGMCALPRGQRLLARGGSGDLLTGIIGGSSPSNPPIPGPLLYLEWPGMPGRGKSQPRRAGSVFTTELPITYPLGQ